MTMPRKHASPGTPREAAAEKRRDDDANGGIPAILPWSANEHAKTWDLITHLSRPENLKVLLGKRGQKENPSGESKNAVFTRIGRRIWPEYASIDKKVVAQRTKDKYEGLINTYRAHAKRLLQTQTGGGTGADPDGPHERRLRFYIPPGGPDAATPSAAQNLWQQITADFAFFPALHAIVATLPNVTPICVTTGVGPHGSETVLIQEPSGDERGADGAGSAEAAEALCAEGFDFSQFAPAGPGGELTGTGRAPASFLEALSAGTARGARDIISSNAANVGYLEAPGYSDLAIDMPQVRSRDGGDTAVLAGNVGPPSMHTRRENRPRHRTHPQPNVALGNGTKATPGRPPKRSQIQISTAKVRDKTTAAGIHLHRRHKAALKDSILGIIRLNQEFQKAMFARHERRLNLEERKLLVEEVREGLITRERARERIEAMRAREREAEAALEAVDTLGADGGVDEMSCESDSD